MSDPIPVTLVVEQLRRRVPGGIGRYTDELVRAVVERADPSFDVSLYASRVRGTDPLASYGLPVVTAPWPAPVLTRLWDVGIGALRGAGVVHATSLAAPPTHRPFLVTMHDLAFRAVPGAFTERGRTWHERALRRAARRARTFVVPSEAVAGDLIASGLGVRGDRVRVIPEGADHLGRFGNEAAGGVLGRLGVAGRFILSVGTLEPRKNLERLISAFGRVRDELDEPLDLVVCGPIGWKVELAHPPGVVFAGHVSDEELAGLYRRAAAVAYVPLHEGFGLPVLEAQHAGAVVVSSAVPSAGAGTHLVDPFDIEAIGDGLVRCVTDEALRDRLRAEGHAHAAEYTWARTAAAHAALWAEIA